ncbi:MAG: DNA mismatch repair endonuclease MutL [Abditibacteriota bacterium]|nr:DNA mismatch repair endonuclease MutL [Abditibacteriota bacterium]
MSKPIINQLDEITANQIAAGEVVERPASVVKELVENSIDAKATKIKIETEEGGVKLIRVTDNGVGMCREDAIMCLQRHATSKISNSSDLALIKTLGFRGEALPSIASVSIMTLTTCDNDENKGLTLHIKGGVIEDCKEIGFSHGTSVEVCDLFFNTPARLKFMKSKSTEYSHIVNLISEYAICYPNIRFELVKDKKTTLISAPNGRRMNAIASVLGLDVAKSLFPFQAEEEGVKVYGYISKADLVRGSRKDEYLFVNGRSVKNRNILYAVEFPYKNLLGPGKYPICIVFVEVDDKLIDVNVHPTKSEIKFANERGVYSVLYKAVNRVLMSGGGMASATLSVPKEPSSKPTGSGKDTTTPSLHREGGVSVTPQEFATPAKTFQNTQGTLTRPGQGGVINKDHPKTENYIPTKEEKSAFNPAINQNSEQENIFDPFDWSNESVPKGVEETPMEGVFSKVSSSVDLSAIKIISQYKNTYIICECVNGIVFIDQHVAHERVLYNQMIKRDYSHNYINPLLVPQNINLTAVEASLVMERLEELRQVGYDLEPFGNNTFIMRGFPSEIKEKDSIKVFKDIVEELREMVTDKKLVVRPEQVLISAACKKAIKAGQPLKLPEMQNLVNELLKTDNPYTCPHNRPIIVSLSDYDLNHKFKRV